MGRITIIATSLSCHYQRIVPPYYTRGRPKQTLVRLVMSISRVPCRRRHTQRVASAFLNAHPGAMEQVVEQEAVNSGRTAVRENFHVAPCRTEGAGEMNSARR